MFAAGTSAGFGKKTLLVDQQRRVANASYHENSLDSSAYNFLGGDCSNAACVPSKSMRAVARIVAGNNHNPSKSIENGTTNTCHTAYWTQMAQQHANYTVSQVRAREDVGRMQENDNLDIRFCSECQFESSHGLILHGLDRALYTTCTSSRAEIMRNDDDGSTNNNATEATTSSSVHVTSKKFLIATGAGPIIPQKLQHEAEQISLPLWTYRTFLQPEEHTAIASSLQHATSIVIAGGGSTACELAQIIARLAVSNVKRQVTVTIVAPSILLPSEDVSARLAAQQILGADGIRIINGHRVTGCFLKSNNDYDYDDQKKYIVTENGVTLPCDALLLAVGRSPGYNLQKLHLHKADVAWSYKFGVEVNDRLKSKTQSHVFACGDCASAIQGPNRRASHAAWTGYHAVRNMFAPKFLQSCAVHPFVPRVTFTDPEIASVGLSHVECLRRYGKGGFQFVRVPEEGTDRGDMDSIQRKPIGFTELRVRRNQILGATVCSPAAAEAINEVAVALNAGLSCDDLARTLHCYPSYGYPLQRIALSISLSSVWGLLASCGKFGSFLGAYGRMISRPFSFALKRKHTKAMRDWQAMGADRMLMVTEDLECVGRSFLDVADDDDFCERAIGMASDDEEDGTVNDSIVYRELVAWLDQRPC